MKTLVLSWFTDINCVNYRSDGGYSSAWLERQVVALEVTGSSPVTHPSCLRRKLKFFFSPSSSGLGLRVFIPATGVRVPLGRPKPMLNTNIGFFTNRQHCCSDNNFWIGIPTDAMISSMWSRSWKIKEVRFIKHDKESDLMKVKKKEISLDYARTYS